MSRNGNHKMSKTLKVFDIKELWRDKKILSGGRNIKERELIWFLKGRK